MAATVRPKVGIGVCVLSPDHPGCVLLGQRLAKTAAGVGTWALPGGHLEHGESWAACAEREVLEETGLNIKNVRVGTIMNVVDAPTNYHYVVMFMVGDAAAGATPVNCEPDKCAGWSWHKWSGEFPSPVFKTLSEARAIGFNPFKPDPQLLQDPHDKLPPYCCCILHFGDTLLFEKRGEDATVAAGKYTCFGGKREENEAPFDCITRELKEELGIAVVEGKDDEEDGAAGPSSSKRAKREETGKAEIASDTLERAVDLYVDGELIAWFYAAPLERDTPLVYEPGRTGVTMSTSEVLASYDEATESVTASKLVSPWHVAAIEAWRNGNRRADYVTPP